MRRPADAGGTLPEGCNLLLKKAEKRFLQTTDLPGWGRSVFCKGGVGRGGEEREKEGRKKEKKKLRRRRQKREKGVFLRKKKGEEEEKRKRRGA